jgi:hypothetical protein
VTTRSMVRERQSVSPQRAIPMRSRVRVLTTASRKPPLRTAKFLGFQRVCLRENFNGEVKMRRIRLLRTHSLPKRPHEQPRSGESGPKWRGQTAKTQFLASKPPILTELFGPMWLARVGGLRHTRSGPISGDHPQYRITRSRRATQPGIRSDRSISNRCRWIHCA